MVLGRVVIRQAAELAASPSTVATSEMSVTTACCTQVNPVVMCTAFMRLWLFNTSTSPHLVGEPTICTFPQHAMLLRHICHAACWTNQLAP